MALEDSDVQKLSTELKEFTQALSKFNKIKNPDAGSGSTPQNTDAQKAATNFDKSTQKIVNALGALSAAMTKNNRSKAQETAYIDKFTKSIEKATDAQEEKQRLDEIELAHIKTVLDWQKKTSEEQKRKLAEDRAEKEKADAEAAKARTKKARDDEREALSEKLSNLTRAKDSNLLAESLLSARTAGNVFSSRLAETSALTQVGFAGLNAAVKGATDGLKSYASAVYKGERGAAVGVNAAASLVTPFVELGKTVGSAMVALGTLASWVGRFIPGWGTAAAVLGKGAAVAGAALYSAAKSAELYIELQKLGAEQTNKLFKSYQSLSQSGLSTARGMDDVFSKVQQLGMSVSEIENFTKLLTNGSKSLAMFGDGAAKGASKFTEVAGELVTGELGQSLRMLGVTADDQREAALLYMSIQARTGQIQDKSSKDLAKGTSNLIKEMDMLAQLTGSSVEEQKKHLEMANAEDQFQAAMDDAQSRNDQVRITELENYRMMSRIAAAAGDEAGAKGLLQQGAGAFSNELATKAAMTYLGGGGVRTDRLMTIGEAAQSSQRGMISTRDQYRGISNYLQGGVAGTGMSTMGSAALQKGISVLGNVSEAKDPDAALKQAQEARLAQGGATKAQVQAGILQDKAAQIMDSAVNKFSSAAWISEQAAKAFDAVVEKFGDFVGVDKSGYAKKQQAANSSTSSKLSDMASTPQTIKTGISENLSDVKAAMMKRGEKDENYLTATLANIMKETGGANKPEDLSGYANTSNSSIRGIFGDRVKNMTDAQLNNSKANQQTFAETIYGGEYGKKNLGNIEPGDAWKYRGRGYVQLTGKANYAAASQAIFGNDTLVQNPDLITQDSKVAADVTAWFMERGKSKLANQLGISENKTTRDEAALLATSVIANRDARSAGSHIQRKLESVMGSMNSKELSSIQPTGGLSAKPTQDGGLVDPKLEGLNVKIGDVHKPGSKLDDRIPALAKKVQSEVAGFERFTGFNDSHSRSATSKHPEGKALDFTLGYRPTAEQGAEIVNQLRDIGFAYAQDEYNNPSSKATAPHIHAQLARTGGIFKGPSTGYNVELHGEEMVIPANEGVSKQALNPTVFNQNDTIISDLASMFEKMNEKYDTMIELLANGNEYSEKLVAAAV